MTALCLGGVALTSVCAFAADNVFLYSSTNQIRGINLDLGTENLLTSSPFTNSMNALATNSDDGLVYYGEGTEIFYWDINAGNGASAHTSLNDFATGSVQAPITNLQSGSGSYLGGVYYVGSELNNGDVDDLYAITLSTDGSTVVSAQALGLLNACNCTSDEIGGFGDIAAVQEGADTVLYGISTNGSDANISGRWRFNLTSNIWTHLASGANGQLSNSISGQLYTNVGNSIRTLNKTTGAVGTTSLFTTAAAIYDLTSGFSFDFGDAPGSYGAAIHRIPAQVSSTTYLGTLPPDNEAGTLDSTSGGVNGLGDDQSGADDEDAVASLNTMSINDTSYAFAVSCTAGAYVSAWIDFNLNGSFDPGERNDNAPLPCLATPTTLAWTALSGTTAGASYARIRVADSIAQVSQPTGISNSGEVEDHSLTILGPATAGNCPAGQISSVYASSDVPKTIPVGASSAASSTLTIPTTTNVLDINVVNVVGTHSWLDDMDLSLIRGGTSVALFGSSCGNNDDFDFGFDDESGNALVCPPTNGNNISPTDPLSVFDGVPATGDWVLDIQDTFPTEDGGQLQSWGLEICTLAGPAENPQIRLGKVALIEGDQVTMTFRALNSGNTSLSSITLNDNLDDAFGAGNYTIIQTPQIVSAPTGFIANAAYTGSAPATNLIGNSGTLAPSEDLLIRLVVRIDTQAASTAQSVFSNQANTNAISTSSSFVQDLSAPSLDLSSDTDAPTPITIRNTLTVGGRLFVDNSPNPAHAHDGLIQTDEQGVGNRLVTLIDPLTGQSIDSVLSDGNGNWSLELDGDLDGIPLQIQVQPSTALVFVSEAANYSSGLVTDGVLSVTPDASSSQNDINVGLVPRPVLQSDNIQTALPNSTVRHAHQYVASSTGTLNFTLNSSATQTSTLWPDQLLLDQNCNGILDPADLPLSPSIEVMRDDRLCIIVDVFVPANAPVGATHTARVTASLLLDDSSSTGHGLQFTASNTDIVTVIARDNGRLVLTKTVANITLGDVAAQNNVALPGHVLQYSIEYTNLGSGTIKELVINDAAPAFTQVQSGSVLCAVTPVELACTPASDADLVRWDFTGELPVGVTGTVHYRVTID